MKTDLNEELKQYQRNYYAKKNKWNFIFFVQYKDE